MAYRHLAETELSRADRHITERLRDALALVDVRALDHLVVGAARWCRSPSGVGCSGGAADHRLPRAWSSALRVSVSSSSSGSACGFASLSAEIQRRAMTLMLSASG